jgi:hypothetical protein
MALKGLQLAPASAPASQFLKPERILLAEELDGSLKYRVNR